MSKEAFSEEGYLYHPPRSADDLGSTTEELEAQLLVKPDDANVLFALGNQYFRKGSAEKAVAVYNRLLALDARQAEVRNNLAIAYMQLGDAERAVNELKAALSDNSELVFPYLNLARIYESSGDEERAMHAARKAAALDDQSGTALAFIGECLERNGEIDQAVDYYQRALDALEDKDAVLLRLTRINFLKGKERFELGCFEDSFSIWAKARQSYGPLLWTDRELAQSMRVLIRKFKSERGIERSFAEYANSLKRDPAETGGLYRLFLRFLFTVELVDECFEQESCLAEAERYWRAQAETEGRPPYANFRLALILVYLGQIEEALAQLKLCQDICMPKKHYSLKLKEIFNFVRMVRDFRHDVLEDQSSPSPLSLWERLGFDNPFVINAWQGAGFEPEEAALWRDQGFSAEQGKVWKREKVSAETARIWSSEGFSDPRAVRRWLRGGLKPSEAKLWQDSLGEHVELAVQFAKLGVGNPADAAQWLKIFALPLHAVSWIELGFTPDEADKWLSQGVSDPFLANKLKSKREKPDS